MALVIRLALCLFLATAAKAQLPSNYNITSGRYGVHIPGSKPDNIYEPLEMRTAFAGATGITVSWNTFASLTNPTVQYGTDPRKLDMVASSNVSITYPSSRTYNNHVKLTGLTPFTKYYYKVQYLNCLNCAYRQLGEFTTARAAGDTSSFKVAIVADMGTMGPSGLSDFAPQLPLGSNETNAIQSMLQNIDSYEFIAHWGDFAYADCESSRDVRLGTKKLRDLVPDFIQELSSGTFGAAAAKIAPDAVQLGNGYEGILEEFYDDLTPLTYNTVYMTAPGNHEASCDGGKGTIAGQTYNTSFCPEGQKNFTGYINHWRMPDSPVNGSQGNFWYSFDYGLAHFVVIDTETDFLNAPDMSATLASGPFGKTGQQMAWLQADLQNVDRSKTPWVVVGGHRPWYVSGSNGGSNACVPCLAAFDSIMVNNSVDFVMTGHVHAYDRSWPTSGNGTNIQKTYNNPTLPVYFTNGAGGHWQGIDFLDNPANYSAKSISGVYGWSTIEFHNRTHMTYNFVASANDTILDSVTLFKAHA